MRLSGIMLLDFALVAFGYGLAVSWPLRPPKVRGSISVADVFRKSLVFRWLFARSRRVVARQVLLRSPPPRSGSAKLLLSFSLLRVFRPSLAACAIRFIFAVARLGVRDHSSKKRGVVVCFPTVARVCDLRTCFFVRTLKTSLVFIVCVVGVRRGSRGFFVDFGFRVACRSRFERKCAQCRWLFSLRHVHARNPVSPQFLVGGAVLVEASHALPLNLASHRESCPERALRPLCFPCLFFFGCVGEHELSVSVFQNVFLFVAFPWVHSFPARRLPSSLRPRDAASTPKLQICTAVETSPSVRPRTFFVFCVSLGACGLVAVCACVARKQTSVSLHFSVDPPKEARYSVTAPSGVTP